MYICVLQVQENLDSRLSNLNKPKRKGDIAVKNHNLNTIQQINFYFQKLFK